MRLCAFDSFTGMLLVTCPLWPSVLALHRSAGKVDARLRKERWSVNGLVARYSGSSTFTRKMRVGKGRTTTAILWPKECKWRIPQAVSTVRVTANPIGTQREDGSPEDTDVHAPVDASQLPLSRRHTLLCEVRRADKCTASSAKKKAVPGGFSHCSAYT